MKKLLLVLILILIPSLSFSQATGTSKLLFDQSSPTLVEANSYTYKYYPDTAITGIILTPVICTGTTSPFTCSVSFPAFTPGTHTIQLTAGNTAGESVKSTSFSFTFVVIPGIPVNIRIG
jgi:hypothetical protein